jgi:hypothetical protein
MPPPFPPWLVIVICLLAIACVVLSVCFSKRATKRFAAVLVREAQADERDQVYAGFLPTRITVTRDGVEHPCTWVQLDVALPADLGGYNEADRLTIEPGLPGRTAVRVLAAKEVGRLFDPRVDALLPKGARA